MPLPTQERMRRFAPDGEDALIRRIEALERAIGAASLSSVSVSAFSDGASGVATIPTTWTVFSSSGTAGEYTIPTGFPVGVFTVTVTAGDTLQSGSTSTIAVQPGARAKYADGTYSAWAAFGASVASSGPSTVMVASATTSTNFSTTTPDPVHGRIVGYGFGVYVARTGGTELANNGNWKLTVQAIATRA